MPSRRTAQKARRKVSPQSLRNLRPWRKGCKSPNPAGRPPCTLSEQACRLMTPAKRLKILKAILSKAERGNVQAALCLARLEQYFHAEI